MALRWRPERRDLLLRPPFGFVWMLGIGPHGCVPVIRRLTLAGSPAGGVKKFGDGDLSVRVPDTGQDEVKPTWPSSSTGVGRSGSKRW